MPRLDCITILEAGSFGSDSGTVLVPSGEVPFHIQAFVVGTASGTGTEVGYPPGQTGIGTASGIGTAIGASPPGNFLTEDGDRILTEDGDILLFEG